MPASVKDEAKTAIPRSKRNTAGAIEVEPPQPYGALPTKAQLAWHETELYGLVCLNMPTFTNEEWAYGDKPASLFNPMDFSAEQIVKSAKDGGLKGLVLVCKHHGGLCLWPTKTTEYSIRNSPWKDGKGDIVGELAKAARKQGLKFGAYLSPWDRNHPEYGRPAYVEVYRQQWRELMSNYGEFFELWVDGANGGSGWYGGAEGRRNIDRSTYYGWDEIFKMMKEMQPNAVVFSDVGPDCRWVGNEGGRAGDPCWATITYPLIGDKPPGPGSKVDREILGSGVRNGQQWIPAEADVSIRPGWYYHAGQDSRVRSPQNLVQLYFQTIGRGASLNIGLPPDRRGRLHDNDVASLKKFGDWQRETLSKNLAHDATVTASNVRGNSPIYAARNVMDGKAETYWCTDDDKLTLEIVLDLGQDVKFNVVNIREYLPLGQRVDDWALDAWKDGKWVQFANGTAIGNRRLVRTDYMTTSKVRLRIAKAAACPAIRELTQHREPEWVRKTGKSRE